MKLENFQAALIYSLALACTTIQCTHASEPAVSISPAPSHSTLPQRAQLKTKRLKQNEKLAAPTSAKTTQTAVRKPCGCHGKGRAGQDYKPGERWWAK